MTKDQIESVLDRVRQWPQDRQEEAVDLLLALEARAEDVYRPTAEQQAELEETLREIERGEVASEEEVAAAFRRRLISFIGTLPGRIRQPPVFAKPKRGSDDSRI